MKRGKRRENKQQLSLITSNASYPTRTHLYMHREETCIDKKTHVAYTNMLTYYTNKRMYKEGGGDKTTGGRRNLPSSYRTQQGRYSHGHKKHAALPTYLHIFLQCRVLRCADNLQTVHIVQLYTLKEEESL